MIKIATDWPGWRVISHTDNSADVLARAAAGATDPASRWRALELLRDADGTLSTVRQPDGHFQWKLSTRHGQLIAESPPLYRDVAACRRGFADARRAAAKALDPDPSDDRSRCSVSERMSAFHREVTRL
jgi:uncharacterized protein YegP (UPF0339 family)